MGSKALTQVADNLRAFVRADDIYKWFIHPGSSRAGAVWARSGLSGTISSKILAWQWAQDCGPCRAKRQHDTDL